MCRGLLWLPLLFSYHVSQGGALMNECGTLGTSCRLEATPAALAYAQLYDTLH